MWNPIVIGCNYHTTWQKHKAMRFVLRKVEGDKAQLGTRTTNKIFWTNISDLIFINTTYNTEKAIRLLKPNRHESSSYKNGIKG